ncbi:MAG: VCBS repeat-containing protein [Candidatus Aminicenantes bacterium]|jgi:hypothetical protein
MKVLKKIKPFHILIILLCGISFMAKGTPVYGDDYVKVWDSGTIIPNPVLTAVIGDQDSDGKREIIVSDLSGSYNSKIYILENVGDNSYQLVWDSGGILTGNDIYWDKAVGDLDKDGKREIITIDHVTSSGKIKVYVLENAGDNNYQLVWDSGNALSGELGAVALFVGDADSDGKSEIIAGTGWRPGYNGKIYVFENTGDNTYKEVWNSGSTLSDCVETGAVGDLDKDGKREIIVGSGDLDPQVHVFENTGDNSYALVWDSGDFFHRQLFMTIGDADKDGNGEIIAGGEDRLIGVFENAGDNSYRLAWASPLMPYFVNYVFIGDQDNDGQREIIAACDDRFYYGIAYVFENTSNDTYEIAWDSGDILGERVSQAIPAETDDDGKGEIIVPCFDGKVYVFEHPGTPTLTVKIDIKPGSWPNAINPRNKGVIPAAILTTGTAVGESVGFDATTVDPLSVKFGPGEAVEAHGKGHIEDVDNDGDLDMVLRFKTQETGIQYGDTEACLTGKTFDGKYIQACDTIKTVSKEKK